MKRLLMLIAIAGVAVTPMAAPSPSTEVTLTIPHEALACLSVPLHIRVRNGGSTIELAPSVFVLATSPLGETFRVRWNDRDEVGPLELGLTDEDAETLVVRPGSIVELSIPAVPLMDSSWAQDPRIATVPGKWTLQVALRNERDGSKLTSNPATLIVNPPAVRDVRIVQELMRGELWQMADRVLTEQPDSPYFPYIVTAVRRVSSLEKIEIIDRAIRLHPDSPVVPRLRHAIAEYYGMEADRVFFAERDFDKAASLAEKGRAELARLKNMSDPWARLTAARREGEFPSREGYVELQRLQREKGTHQP